MGQTYCWRGSRAGLVKSISENGVEKTVLCTLLHEDTKIIGKLKSMFNVKYIFYHLR